MAQNLEVNIPSAGWYSDIQSSTKQERIYSNDEADVFSLVNLANKYLWFSLWVVAMIVLVVAWYKLVTARWDEKEMKTVNNLLVGLVVWVLIAIFSYLLVRLASNLF